VYLINHPLQFSPLSSFLFPFLFSTLPQNFHQAPKLILNLILIFLILEFFLNLLDFILHFLILEFSLHFLIVILEFFLFLLKLFLLIHFLLYLIFIQFLLLNHLFLPNLYHCYYFLLNLFHLIQLFFIFIFQIKNYISLLDDSKKIRHKSKGTLSTFFSQIITQIFPTSR
jgi:hypothetical protein